MKFVWAFVFFPVADPHKKFFICFFFRWNEEAKYDRMNEKWTRAVRTQSNQANCLSTTFSTSLSNCFVYNLMRNFDSQKRVTFLSKMRFNGIKSHGGALGLAACAIETYLWLFLFIICWWFVCRQVIMRFLRSVAQSLASISPRACDFMYGNKSNKPILMQMHLSNVSNPSISELATFSKSADFVRKMTILCSCQIPSRSLFHRPIGRWFKLSARRWPRWPKRPVKKIQKGHKTLLNCKQILISSIFMCLC